LRRPNPSAHPPLHREPEVGTDGEDPDPESLVRACHLVTINAPSLPETENLFDDALLAKMKRGAYLINTARGRVEDGGRLAGTDQHSYGTR
jgi:formate dehydrogenase